MNEKMKSIVNIHTECDRCIFCYIFKTPPSEREIIDTVLIETESFVYMPGLGAFVEGYSLVVAKKHVHNTGCHDIKTITELKKILSNIKQLLIMIYGISPILFEHGVVSQVKTGGSCIDHHHIHILPIEITEPPQILLKNFTGKKIEDITELQFYNEQDKSYLFFETSNGEQFVFDAGACSASSYIMRIRIT